MTYGQVRLAALLASGLLFTACSGNSPPQLAGGDGQVPKVASMSEAELGGRDAMIYRAPNLDVRKYSKFIIDPVEIYSGADAQWSGTSMQERQQMAQFMRSEFIRALGNRYVTQTPGPGVARVKLVLAGLDDNVPVAATVTRLAPAGLVMNVFNQAAGQPGSFTGSTTIAGSILDSQSNALLMSFIQKRSPDALDIGATLSSRDAQQAAISQGAEAFRKRLDALHPS